MFREVVLVRDGQALNLWLGKLTPVRRGSRFIAKAGFRAGLCLATIPTDPYEKTVDPPKRDLWAGPIGKGELATGEAKTGGAAGNQDGRRKALSSSILTAFITRADTTHRWEEKAPWLMKERPSKITQETGA